MPSVSSRPSLLKQRAYDPSLHRNEKYSQKKLFVGLEVCAEARARHPALSRKLEKFDNRDAVAKTIIKRIERTRLCFEWMDKLNSSSFLTEDGKDGERARVLAVRYYRHSIKTPHGVIEYGRRYAYGEIGRNQPKFVDKEPRSMSLQGAPKEVRRWLCSDYYHDVDICNCFPVIAIWLASKYCIEMPMLTHYAEEKKQREEMLAKIIQTHSLIQRCGGPSKAREAAKRLPLSLLHGGSYNSWKYNEKIPQKETEVNEMATMAKEIVTLCDHMRRSNRVIEANIFQNEDIFKRALDRDTSRSATNCLSDMERSMLAYVLQSYESHILDLIHKYAQDTGWHVSSLQFDGLFIEHRKDFELDALIRGAETYVYKETGGDCEGGLKIALEEKELYNSNTDSILNEWKHCAIYDAHKCIFEDE